MDKVPVLPVDLSSAWLELGDARRTLLRGYPGVVLLLAPDGRVFSTNPAGAERLGRDPDLRDTQADATLTMPLSAVEDATVVSRSEALQPGAEHDWTLRHRDGSPQPMRLSIEALRDRDGAVIGLIAVEPWPRGGEDAEPLFRHHDTLTGLPTRDVLADRAEMALQHAARQKKLVAVLLIEIVGFDSLSRTRGRDAGDELLRGAASRLHFELRKTDTAVRLDGGQFVVLLADLNRPEEATQVAEKIGRGLSVPISIGTAKLSLAVRVGVAWSPAHGDQLLPLIQAAEAALDDVDAERGGVANAKAAAVA